MTSGALIPADRVARAILPMRGQRVILDEDLAALYGVETRHLVQAVRRNADRFPDDFSFRLTAEEWASLRSRIVISKSGRGGRRHAPHVFTEHGALMAAAVLNTPVAVQVSLQVVRAFVRTRHLLAANQDLARRVATLERNAGRQESNLRALSEAFRERLEPRTGTRRRRIGFATDEAPLEGAEIGAPAEPDPTRKRAPSRPR